MKRRLLVLPILLVLFITLGGCAPKEDDGQTDNSNREYDLLVWEDIEKSSGIADAVVAFEELHDVKIKVVEKAYASQNEDLRLDGPAKIGPDVVTLPSDQIGSLVVEGLLKEIILTEEEQNIYSEAALQAQQVDGKFYGVPKAVETIVLFYNKDMIQESDLPTTLDEWYETSKKFRENNQYGLLALWDQIYYAQSIMSPYGAYIFNLDSEGNYDVNDIGLANQGSVEAVEYISKFYKDDIFPAGIIGEQGINVLDSLFSEGKAAAVISGPWNLKPFNDAGINYGVKELPILPNGEHMSSFVGVKSYNVSSYAENPELAEEFIKFIANAENSKIRYEKTLEVPAVKSLADDPVVKENEGSQAVATQSIYGELTPSIPQMNEVWEPVNAALEQIATGSSDYKMIMEDAVQFIKDQIDANH